MTDTSNRPTCETCRWWVQRTPRRLGECRRNPPQIVPDYFVVAPSRLDRSFDVSRLIRPIEGMWPQTQYLAFCGEHEPKEVR